MAEDKSQGNESQDESELDEAIADATSDTLKTNTEAESDPQFTEGQSNAADS